MDNNNNTTDNISHNPPSTSATLTTTTSAAATITTSTTTTTTTANNNKYHFLRHLNKLSHKISKPTLPSSNFTGSSSSTFKKPQLEPPPLQPPVHPPQQQPPVYNINKSQFRDVVQKLTGSPAHPTGPPHPPPSIQPSKPTSSRLQRFRPPPLAQLNARPPPLINPSVNPLSPLPPLPTCHAAAESPISAYMRFLHNSVTSGHFLQPPQAPTADATTAVPPFGYFPSPKSPCPLLSPNLVFSPTGNGSLGFPQLPVSPTVPGVPSPKWSDL